MIAMKALRSCNMGTNATKVQRGREFTVLNEQRARDLEEAGLAYRLETKTIASEPMNKMLDEPSNEAATAGPLVSPGGTTGAEAPAPSSPQDHPQRRRRSPRSKTDADLLS